MIEEIEEIEEEPETIDIKTQPSEHEISYIPVGWAESEVDLSFLYFLTFLLRHQGNFNEANKPL